MMLCHPQLDGVLDFAGTKVPTMVVEAPSFLRLFLQDMYEQLDGMDGQIQLMEQDKRLPFGTWVEVIDNFLHFELNTKSLLNKIIAAMERMSSTEMYMLKTADILQRVESYADELAFAFDCDIACSHCTVSGLLKGMGITVRDEYDDPLERLIDYMELVREFDRDKLFVYVNLRSFFSDEEVTRFLATALNHGYRILLLDAQDHAKLPLENRITIDKDLCEF